MGWGSYYLFWLIVPTILAIVSAHPSVLLLILLALILRRWIPDPYLFFKHAGRIRSLSNQIAANPENSTARRDLAMIYLEKRRPRKALPHLQAALEREPDAAELHYLLGLAHLGLKEWQPAVDAFSRSLHEDERLRYGDPYLRCGDALVRLGRLDEAEEGYRRFLSINTSSVEGRVKLAAVKKQKGDLAACDAMRKDARETFGQLPGFQRRKQFFWYLRARF